MTPDEMCQIVLSFPGAEEGTSYGYPAFKLNGKFLTRLRSEDASLVLMEVGPDDREMLMEADPATWHITPHYASSNCILARIASLEPGSLKGLLERRFRKIAKKAVVKAWDAREG